MFTLKQLLVSVAGAAGIVLATTTHASSHDEHRQHDSHVHGEAQLDLVQDGPNIHIEVSSPAANIVGFEHAPANDADQQTLHHAIERLEDGQRMFLFSEAAHCLLDEAVVSSPWTEESEHHHDEHHEEHADENHEEHGDEHHEKHVHEHHDEHQEEHADNNHEEHGDEHHEKHAGEHHDEHGDEHQETHSDISAAYHFVCKDIDALKEVTVKLFEEFPATHELHVQFVTNQGQGGMELTSAQPTLPINQ